MNKLIKNNESLVWAFGVIIFMLALYLIEVQIWNVTSPTYKPANFVDFEVKTPLDKEEWLVRREHGVCPFNTNDFDPSEPLQGFKNC